MNICIYIYIYVCVSISEVGGKKSASSPQLGNRIRFVRACGRGEAVRACETMLLLWLRSGRSKRTQGQCPSVLFLGSAAKSFVVLSSA